jgi:hypothetical protein
VEWMERCLVNLNGPYNSCFHSSYFLINLNFRTSVIIISYRGREGIVVTHFQKEVQILNCSDV